MKKVYKTAIIFLAGIIFNMAAFAEQNAADSITSVTASGNQHEEHPVELIFDNDESSWYSLKPFSQSAEVKIKFDQPYYIDTAEISGYIPEGALLYLQYEQYDEIKTIGSSFVRGETDSVFIDATRERIILDNLIIRILGGNLDDFRINDIQLGTTDCDKELTKKKLYAGSSFNRKNLFNNDFILVDGKIGTIWQSADTFHGRFSGMHNLKNFRGNWMCNSYPMVYTLKTPGKVDFLKYYINKNGTGRMMVSVLVNNKWISVEQINMSWAKGWQKIDLSNFESVSAVKLDNQGNKFHMWGFQDYGGIAEIEIWGHEKPDQTEVYEILPPAAPYEKKDIVFVLSCIAGAELTLNVVTGSEQESAPELTLGNASLKSNFNYETGFIKVWEYSLDEESIDYKQAGIKIESVDAEVYCVQVISKPSQQIQLSDNSLTDGIRYSGRENSEQPLFTELTDGSVDIEEILLFYRNQIPEDFYIQEEGVYNYILPAEEEINSLRFTEAELADSMGLDYSANVQEIEVKGSPLEIVNPYIQFLLPSDNSEMSLHSIWNNYILGISDSPNGEININGQRVIKRNNFFWINMRDLKITEPGEYSLTAEVCLPDGKTGTDTINIFVVSDSDKIIIDQKDEIHYTRDDVFTISGRIKGHKGSLYINEEAVSLRHSRFKENIGLAYGLNDVVIELYSDSGEVLLDREYRQVFRMDDEPMLTISAPVNNSMVNNEYIEVRGQVSTAGLRTVLINGFPARIGNNSYSHSHIPVMQEYNTITVKAMYTGGLSVERQVEVSKDVTAPDILEVSPLDGTVVGDFYAAVTGKVVDDNSCTVMINGIAADISGENFSAVVPLNDEGNNKIHVVARDQAGNEASWPVFSVFRDMTGPEPFEVSADPAGWTNNRRPVITFSTTDKTSDMSHYEVSINGSGFNKQVSPYKLPYLDDGIIPVTVRAFDEHDNYTDASVNLYIDTEAPAAPQTFRAVPGFDNSTLKWTEDDETVSSFVVGIYDTDQSIIVDKNESGQYQHIFENLEPGKVYSFYIQSTDMAGNTGERFYSAITTSAAVVEINGNGMDVLEYDDLELCIPQGALPEQVSHVIMRQVEYPFAEEQAENPILSPIYSFSVANTENEEQNHLVFKKPFVGKLSYDEGSLPDDVPEYKLAVFYFDEDWGRWFLAEENRIDPDNNEITFASNHFSEFSIQPTSSESVDYRDWKGVQFPLTSKTTSHAPLAVSPQGGGLSTSMTEFTLPGLNGMDFILKRSYSSTQADSDSTLLPVNAIGIPQMSNKFSGSGNSDGNPDEIWNAYMNSPAATNGTWLSSRYKTMMQNRAEYAYALGQGWRLDLPYVKFTDKHVMVKTPGGGFAFTKDLEKTSGDDTGDITYTDTLNGQFTISLHRERVKQSNTQSSSISSSSTDNSAVNDYTISSGSSGEIFRITSIEMITSNGIINHFNDEGFIEYIRDPYGNELTFEYDNLKLIKITDTLKREIVFSYLNIDRYVPLISSIQVFDKEAEHTEANAKLTVTYTYDTDLEHSAGLPLLVGAKDVGGRDWQYFYSSIHLQTKYNLNQQYTTNYYPDNTKNQYVFPLCGVKGPGLGDEVVGYGKRSAAPEAISGIDYEVLKETYSSMGSEKELKARTYALAASRLDLLEDGKVKRTTTYSYKFNDEGGITRTVTNNSRIRNVYDFKEMIYKINKRDVKFFGYTIDTRHDEVKATFQVRNRTYITYPGPSRLYEDSITKYYGHIQKPEKTVTVTNPERGYSDNWSAAMNEIEQAPRHFETSYKYDKWGNALYVQNKEFNDDYTHINETWSWYQAAPPNIPEITPAPPEIGDSNVRNTIKNRFYRTYSTYRTIGSYENEAVYPQEEVYQYNEQGSLIASAVMVGDKWSVSRKEYNNNGSIVKNTSSSGQETVMDYNYDDPDYFILTMKDLDVEDENGELFDRAKFTYLDRITGFALIKADAYGKQTLFEYDKLGRIKKITKPKKETEAKAPEISANYDIPNTVIQTDELKNKAVYRFNDRYEIEKIETYKGDSELLTETYLTYDYFGNLVKIITPGNNILHYSYDGLGRPLEERYTEFGQERLYSYEYDIFGKYEKQINEKGIPVISYFDTAGRTVKTEFRDSQGYFLRSTQTRYDAAGNVIRESDYKENVSKLNYDQQGRLIELINPKGSYYGYGDFSLVSRSYYNCHGQLESEVLQSENDKIFSRKTYEYDKLGRLSKEKVYYQDIDGNDLDAETSHFYDALDREVKTVDANKNEWTKIYDVRGQLTSEINPRHASVSYEYDQKGRLVAKTDALENSGNYADDEYNGTVIYEYDALDRVVKGIFPGRTGQNLREIEYEYDKDGNLLKQTNPDGSYTEYTYSEHGKMTKETRHAAADVSDLTYTTKYYYDPVGNVVKTVMPGGVVYEAEYDDLGRKIADIQPEGITTHYGYDKNSNLLWTQNGLGFRKYNEYDDLNRVIKMIDQESGVWKYGYHPLGGVNRTIDPNGVERTVSYDSRGSRIEETDGRGNISRYKYDPNGNLVYSIDPRKTEVSLTYREDNLPLEVDYINAEEGKKRHVSYSYNEAGGKKSASDNGTITLFNYINDKYVPDSSGKLLNEEIRGHSRVAYFYDKMDRMTSLVNGDYEPVQYKYDAFGRLDSVKDYLESAEYDDRGLLTGFTLGNSLKMNRIYDGIGRMTSLDYNLDGSSVKHYEYVYDAASNIIAENDNLFIYDGKNQLTTAMFGEKAVPPTESMLDTANISSVNSDVLGQRKMDEQLDGTYALDWAANSLGVDLEYPYLVSKLVLNINADEVNRLSADTLAVYTSLSNQEDSYESVPEFEYDDSGLIAADGRISGPVIIKFKKAQLARYIKVNNSFNDRDNDNNPVDAYISAFLDNENPINIFRQVGGGSNDFYLYDKKGNRIRESVMNGGLEINDYVYYENCDWLKSDGTYSYVYDANGNMILKAKKIMADNSEVTVFENDEYWTYEYDLANRLVQVNKWNTDTKELDELARYEYDIHGYRIRKIKNNEITKFVFDKNGNVIEEISPQGIPERYIFSGSTHIARISVDGTSFYGTNHLGSTVLEINEAGETLIDSNTKPFGDQDNKEMFFTGKKWDDDAQLYYFNARWYDPKTARFITEDPAKDGALWFAYCNNNPMKFVDPTGMETVEERYKNDKARKLQNDKYKKAHANKSDTDRVKKKPKNEYTVEDRYNAEKARKAAQLQYRTGNDVDTRLQDEIARAAANTEFWRRYKKDQTINDNYREDRPPVKALFIYSPGVFDSGTCMGSAYALTIELGYNMDEIAFVEVGDEAKLAAVLDKYSRWKLETISITSHMDNGTTVILEGGDNYELGKSADLNINCETLYFQGCYSAMDIAGDNLCQYYAKNGADKVIGCPETGSCNFYTDVTLNEEQLKIAEDLGFKHFILGQQTGDIYGISNYYMMWLAPESGVGNITYYSDGTVSQIPSVF